MNLLRLQNLRLRTKLSLVAGFFLMFGLFGAVLLSQQQQETRSRAASLCAPTTGDLEIDNCQMNGNIGGNLKGSSNQITGSVGGFVTGNFNRVLNNVTKSVLGNNNYIGNNVGACIVGDNNTVVNNVYGTVTGVNNSVGNRMAAVPCPPPPSSVPTPIPTSLPTPTPTPIPPTPTSIPTPTPTRVPTPTPTPTPVLSTLTPTKIPTPTPIPTTTPSNTVFNISLLLHGIGKGGDSANPNGGGGNTNPLHPQRNVRIEVFNSQNQLALTKDGAVNFSSANGNFTGVVNMGTALVSGSYIVKVKSTQFLRNFIPGIQNITAGAVMQLPQAVLINGDINSNNVTNIIDYNILLGCYSDFQPAPSCTSANKLFADLNDDGNVNQFDYNLFLRELTNVIGQ